MKIYGIDLGTTYSLIGRGDQLYTGLVSSNVNTKEKRQAEKSEINSDIVSSYKVDMTIGSNGVLPIACSAIILKELANRVKKAIGEEVKNVVISVPAKFSHTQREAVCQAAEAAGLNVEGLINEPTAAAIHICKDMKDLILVYDLGGGTFDATILDSRAGSYFVVATDGNGHLAGDNLDAALLNLALKEKGVKMRYKTKNNIEYGKNIIRQAKEEMQKTGLQQYIDMTVFNCESSWVLTKDIYIATLKEVFSPTIKLVKRLIAMNLSDIDKPKLVFVGGSTACPYLKEWVEEELNLESYDSNDRPDFIVAKGVSEYAKMLEDGTAHTAVEDVTKTLSIEDETGMANVVIEPNTIVPVKSSRMFVNSDTSRYLHLNLYQGDSMVCAENDFIGEMIYDYGEVRQPGDGIVDLEISVDHNGIVKLVATDILTNESQQASLRVK